jgi:hypothetical protein
MKKRVFAIVLAASVLLTACNGSGTNQDDDRTTITTRATESEMLETGMSEPSQSIDAVNTGALVTESETAEESVAEPKMTADASGMYTYIIYEGTSYETEVKMSLNVDDYIYVAEKTGSTIFDYEVLVSDLGFEAEPYFYTYDFGDHLALLVIHSLPNVQTKVLGEISFSYTANIQGLPAFDDVKENPGHSGYILAFDLHDNNYVYYMYMGDTSPYSVQCSRDDAIVCAYFAWVIATSVDDSTPIGETFEKFVNPGRGVRVFP